MNLRNFLDKLGKDIENIGRRVSERDKVVDLEYKPTESPKNIKVVRRNKYGEIVGDPLYVRIVPENSFSFSYK